MNYEFRYGRETIEAELPLDDPATLQPELPREVDNVREAISRMLDNPIDEAPLRELVRGQRTIVILIPDATRHAGMQTWLPALLAYLEAHNVRPESITLLIATGSHRIPSADEMKSLVGEEIYANWKVEAHDPDTGNVAVKALEEGVPLHVDQRVVDADLVLMAGPVSYHYTAGFGGGRKLIAPGACARETVRALHKYTLANIDEKSGDWRSRTATLRDNPFHEAVVRAAQRVGPAFALNVIVGWDNRILGAVAGDPIESHLVACLRYDKIFRAPIEKRRPLVIASCGGWPYDVSLYQAHKSIDNAFRAVERGGTLIMLAKCEEGWGADTFVDWLSIESLEEHRRRLNESFEVAGHTAYALKWKATKCRIVVVSDVLAGKVARGEGPAWLREQGPSPFQFSICPTLDDALAAADISGKASGYVVPIAACVLPEYK